MEYNQGGYRSELLILSGLSDDELLERLNLKKKDILHMRIWKGQRIFYANACPGLKRI